MTEPVRGRSGDDAGGASTRVGDRRLGGVQGGVVYDCSQWSCVCRQRYACCMLLLVVVTSSPKTYIENPGNERKRRRR